VAGLAGLAGPWFEIRYLHAVFRIMVVPKLWPYDRDRISSGKARKSVTIMA
jgi:hypothetical protein